MADKTSACWKPIGFDEKRDGWVMRTPSETGGAYPYTLGLCHWCEAPTAVRLWNDDGEEPHVCKRCYRKVRVMLAFAGRIAVTEA